MLLDETVLLSKKDIALKIFFRMPRTKAKDAKKGKGLLELVRLD